MEIKYFIEMHFFFLKLAFRDRPEVFESTGEPLRRWGRRDSILYIVNSATLDEKLSLLDTDQGLKFLSPAQ